MNRCSVHADARTKVHENEECDVCGTDAQLTTKPCADCGVQVLDRDDPEFKDAWLCFYCHCVREGRDPKQALNDLATLAKISPFPKHPVTTRILQKMGLAR